MGLEIYGYVVLVDEAWLRCRSPLVRCMSVASLLVLLFNRSWKMFLFSVLVCRVTSVAVDNSVDCIDMQNADNVLD